MILRPHFLLLRGRLFIAALIALVAVFLIISDTSGSSLFDIGVLGREGCGCPLDPSDTRRLLNAAIVFLIVGALLDFPLFPAKQGGPGASRFLLTRPIPRLHVLLAPFLICAIAIAILPGLAWLLLLGWMHLVHAPALGHLISLLELVPAAGALGPHPTFASLAAATHLSRFYLAGISLGLDAYVIACSARWTPHSPRNWIKWLGLLSSFILFASFGMLPLIGRWLPNSLLFVLPHDSAFTYVPSSEAIALHFAFAAAWFCGTYLVMLDTEF